ncbi:MAG: ABC transporter ATP-binding protein [Nanoarchaeota archaeon]
MLEIRHITKSFGDLKVLDDISYAIRQKMITAIIGTNGAGKTTLFNIIMGILRPEEGMILHGSKDLTKMRTSDISREGISMMFQQDAYFKNLTLEDHLLLCSRDKRKIAEVLAVVGLNKTLDTLVRDMSYGEKKLTGIAMTLLEGHDIILLDEPVAGVNPFLKREILRIMAQLKRSGKTIVFIEHDMDFVREIADESMVLSKGKIIASGKTEDIMQDRFVIETFLGKD